MYMKTDMGGFLNHSQLNSYLKGTLLGYFPFLDMNKHLILLITSERLRTIREKEDLEIIDTLVVLNRHRYYVTILAPK